MKLCFLASLLAVAKPFSDVVKNLQDENKPGFVVSAASGQFKKEFKRVQPELVDLVSLHEADSASNNLVFVTRKGKVVPFTGSNTAFEIHQFIIDQLRDATPFANKNANHSTTKHTKGSVLKLDSKTFNSVVAPDEERSYFIKFYAPWCPHCQSIEGIWKELARKVTNENIVIAEVNADEEKELGAKFGIKGFPTIMMLPPGPKKPKNAVPYTGERTLPGFVSFASKWAGAVAKVEELTTHKQFESACVETDGQLCLVVFLPHIYDSSVAERKKYLTVLKKINMKVSDLPIKYFWTEAAHSLELERSLGLEFGWPAAVLINSHKGVYATHRGKTTEEALSDFIEGVTVGRIKPQKMPSTMPNWPTIEPWDGKAHSPSEEL